MKNNICSKCGHEWMSRVQKPLQCPKCKRYDWNTTKTKIEQGKVNNLTEPKDNSVLWRIEDD